MPLDERQRKKRRIPAGRRFWRKDAFARRVCRSEHRRSCRCCFPEQRQIPKRKKKRRRRKGRKGGIGRGAGDLRQRKSAGRRRPVGTAREPSTCVNERCDGGGEGRQSHSIEKGGKRADWMKRIRKKEGELFPATQPWLIVSAAGWWPPGGREGRGTPNCCERGGRGKEWPRSFWAERGGELIFAT